jgi:glutamate dehydrogenase
MRPHDVWEQQVLTELQADIKRIIGCIIKNMLLNNTSTCADYFDLPSEKQKVSRYRRLYQEVKSVLPVNLMPYLVLAKALEQLLA